MHIRERVPLKYILQATSIQMVAGTKQTNSISGGHHDILEGAHTVFSQPCGPGT
jgi:hypothetical protein